MEITQINKADFVSRLSEVRKAKVDIEGNAVYSSKLTSKKAVGELVEDMLELIVDLASQGIGVKFPAVLETEVVPVPAREGRNPATQEIIQLPATYKVRLSAKKHLKDAVKTVEV
jgi:DNA-binding protein HU-beta